MILLVAGCGKSPEWESLQPDPPQGGEASAPLTWDSLADSCTFVLTEQFLNKAEGWFWSTPGDAGKASAYIYWQQAHAEDVLIAAYKRVRETDKTRAAQYEEWFKKWYASRAHNYNTSRASEGAAGGFFNAFTDDMAWICLTLMHLEEATGDRTYSDTAREVYDKYIIPRAWKDSKGTGLPWQNNEANRGRNACTNAPGMLLAALLHRKYGEQRYLDEAVMLYDFIAANLLSSDGRVEEPPLTYTQGTFAEACRQLYHITGETPYMNLAAKVMEYAFTSGRCTNAETGGLRNEGTSMDQSIFKAVLIPYAVDFVLDEKAPAAAKRIVRERLILNARLLNASLDRFAWPAMFVNYYWGKTFDGSGYASMGAQVSGASLMEGMARLGGKRQ